MNSGYVMVLITGLTGGNRYRMCYILCRRHFTNIKMQIVVNTSSIFFYIDSNFFHQQSGICTCTDATFEFIVKNDLIVFNC